MYLAFNPTMVRLLPNPRCSRFDCRKIFQSHNGAIAAQRRTLTPACRRLSIPQWCDCCGLVGRRSSTVKEILSIPQWCDCCEYDNSRILTVRPLSIPQWCDCCSEKLSTCLTKRRTFNPTMVRLLLFLDKPEWLLGYTFNPTMVRLLLEIECGIPTQEGVLSIPQWCDCCRETYERIFELCNRLSIPQWCDCCLVGLVALAALAGFFQSHNGAIAALTARLST